MSELTRFGVSLDKELLEAFDEHIKIQTYETRSKAIADIIKDYISRDHINMEGDLAGTITFFYDHHNKDLVSKLLEVQHNVHDVVVSMQHIHMDHDNCLEILAVRGSAEEIRTLYHQIKAMKGIKLASVSVIDISPELK